MAFEGLFANILAEVTADLRRDTVEHHAAIDGAVLLVPIEPTVVVFQIHPHRVTLELAHARFIRVDSWLALKTQSHLEIVAQIPPGGLFGGSIREGIRQTDHGNMRVHRGVNVGLGLLGGIARPDFRPIELHALEIGGAVRPQPGTIQALDGWPRGLPECGPIADTPNRMEFSSSSRDIRRKAARVPGRKGFGFELSMDILSDGRLAV